jgi:hypothetical protein
LSALEAYITRAHSLQVLYGSSLPASSTLLEQFSQTYALTAATAASVGQSLVPQQWPTRQQAVQSALVMAASSAAMCSELQVLRQDLWLSLQQVYREHWQLVLAASPCQPVTLLPFHQVGPCQVATQLSSSFTCCAAAVTSASAVSQLL